MARLRVAVLGAPEVCHGSEKLTFATRKALALLLYLVVEGGTHRREKLTSIFWPESDEDAGRATLRSTLARLREGLAGTTGEPHLIIERETVGFDFASDVDLDLSHLRAAYDLAVSTGGKRPTGESRHALVAGLQDGVSAWRGEFLEGFSLRDAPDFDDWASVQREAWHRRMEVVLDRLSQLHADAGSGGSAIETVNRWLRLNPLEERAHRRLMQLHAAAGDRGAALRAYDACRAVLSDELGVQPDPETDALAERIRASPSRPGAERRRPAPLPASLSLEGSLVGREDEFTKLVELYLAAARGQPRAVVLQGEAGIGKTRLAQEFLDWAAAQGGDVLQGRAFEAGARLPYQPLVDALRPRLERETAPDTLLSDTWLTELGRLLPELRDRLSDLPVPADDEAAARTRLFEAVARLGRALAERAPLVLFLDDVQWADIASLDVLRYVGRRWTQDGTPVLLLVSLRTEALPTTPALVDWLRGLHRDLAVAELDLGPLTFDDTRRLLLGVGAGPAVTPELEGFARWIFAETSGQPFFVVETLRTLQDLGLMRTRRSDDGTWVLEHLTAPDQGLLPVGVRRTIQARLAPLSPTARELLTAAAVLGQGFGFELLCRVGRLADDEALPALDAVLQGRLLRETSDGDGGAGDGRYVFAHDKIRDVVYTEAGEARRRVFHRRALDALEGAAPAAELARHAAAAGLDEAALEFSIAAGDAAMSLLAARDAAAHYERAIALAERLGRPDLRGDLHARRGRAFVSVAMWVDARRELEAALAELGSGEHERRADILVDLSDACFWTMDVPAMRRHATEVLALAEQLGRGDLEAKALAWLATAEGSAGNLPACVEQNRHAINRARALGLSPPPVAFFRSMALYWLGRHTEAVPGIREAVGVARDANDVSWTMWSLPNLGLALAGTGRYDEAARAFDEARRMGREYGAETLLARAIACSAGFHLDLFDFAGAEARSQEARELARSLNFTPPAVSAGIDLLLNYARQGEVGQTGALIDEVAAGVEHAAGFHGWLWRLRLAEARAEIALASGSWDEAIRWADEAIAQSRARGRAKYEILGLVTRAQALVALGRAKDASGNLRSAVALARPVGDPSLFLRAAAGLLAVDGDDALAAEGRTVFRRIAEVIPDADLRLRFESAEPLRIFARSPEPGPHGGAKRLDTEGGVRPR